MKLLNSFKLFIIAFLLLSFASCKVKRPSNIIPEATMENLLYDYHVAKALGENLSYNEGYKKSLYLEAVYDKYNISEAEFDTSMVWYTRNIEVLSKIYERINARAKGAQDDIDLLIAKRDKKPLTSVAGDTVDVWAWQRALRLNNTPLYKTYSFILPVDSNFRSRDVFEWATEYSYVGQPIDSTLLAVVGMQIVYENDSVASVVRRVMHSGRELIRLESDTLPMREVNGFIYYPTTANDNMLLIDNISLMRYHRSDSIVTDSITAPAEHVEKESLKEEGITPIDEIKDTEEMHQRANPENMNRPRTNEERVVKPEQEEVEQHIQKERELLEKQRRTNRPTSRTQR